MTDTYNVIGIMSGTSLDGLDIAYCRFEYSKRKWQYHIIKAVTVAYTDIWKKRLSEASVLSAIDFSLLNIEYGKFIGKEVKYFIKKNKLKVDFISCHGHTIFHQPDKQLTVQIGSGANIVAETGLTTICDFRTTDVANKGQGAPLVPIGDKLLFGSFDICINIGGFANLSYQKQTKRIAYDICPANIVLNYLAKKNGKEFDSDGNFAKKGVVCKDLLGKLNKLEYYGTPAPKSLSREWFEIELIPIVESCDISTNDLLRTATEHIAQQIAKTINNINAKKVLVTGGGAFNKFLIRNIIKKCHAEIILPEADVINYKEALIFAFLGILRWRNQNNCLKSVTAAKKDNCGGAVYTVGK